MLTQVSGKVILMGQPASAAHSFAKLTQGSELALQGNASLRLIYSPRTVCSKDTPLAWRWR
jgi:hypothetical protein